VRHYRLAPNRTQQAFRYELAPTVAQEESLTSCAGASRFWFKQGLALVKTRLDERAAGSDVSVPWSYKSLCSVIERERRAELAPWQDEVVCGSYQAGFEALGKALKNFSDGRRAGGMLASRGFAARAHARSRSSSSARARLHARGCRPFLPLIEDLLCVRDSESQAVPVGARLRLRGLRVRAGP
jgi:hypothetical protein